MMKKKIYTALCIAMIGISLSLPTYACSVEETFGFGVRATALGGAFTAVADNFAAAYYNPAGLAQKIGHRVVLEYTYVAPDFEVKTLDGQDLVIYDGSGRVKNDPTEARWGDGLDLPAPVIGIMLDLNETDLISLKTHTELGIAYIGPENFEISQIIASYPPDQPQFLRYGDSIDRYSVALGLGMEFVPEKAPFILYVGGNARATVCGRGATWSEADTVTDVLTGNTYTVSQYDETLWNRANYPGGGILIVSTSEDPKVMVGYSFKPKMALPLSPVYAKQTLVVAGQNIVLRMTVHGYALFTPAMHSLGASLTKGPLMISVQGDLEKWSDYEYSPDVKTHYTETDPDFRDTITPRLGIEYKPNDDTSILLGYFYQPTPIPDQSGRVSNFIDMDKHVFSAGIQRVFRPSFLYGPATVSGMFLYQVCDDYTVDKTGVQGYSWEDQESYTVDGDACYGGISLTLSF